MRKSRFSEQQIIGMIEKHESGMSTSRVCHKQGISEAIFYRSKAKLGGMSVSDAPKLKTLEQENARLKRLPAKTMLDVAVLKDMTKKTTDA